MSGLEEQADRELYCRCWNQATSESCRGVCPEWESFSPQNTLDELRALIPRISGSDGRRYVMTPEDDFYALLAVADAADKLIAGAVGNKEDWLNEWCAMFDAVDAFKKGKRQCSCKPSDCECNLTCHDCGRKITSDESCWGACPECAEKPGYWTKGN